MTLLNLIGSNQFYFTPFHSENHLYSATDLLRAITRFYTGLIEKQIFNILANANLIGNPGQLFKEIAHACIDFANTIFDEVLIALIDSQIHLIQSIYLLIQLGASE